ncbi:MAG: hypothetical protein PF436_09725 [Prolixibacteraceae bacterium]|jgi:hypothetical protein|nr:hypothetical protein [Prolixibacteraceae bacterium]
MKTHTLLIVTIAFLFASLIASTINRASNAEMVNIAPVEMEEELMIEEWMLDEELWGVEENAEVSNEETESPLEIESWMYDANYWGLS